MADRPLHAGARRGPPLGWLRLPALVPLSSRPPRLPENLAVDAGGVEPPPCRPGAVAISVTPSRAPVDSNREATDTEPCKTETMKLAAEIVVVLVLVVPIVVFGYLFVWAARKNGEDDQALQRRLGIRRKTRLGR
jgi:hypothetical protein